MGIFYHPPPPAGRTAVTPPEPHVPIGTQGNQPPRYSTVLMLAAVLASWPIDLEPRLQKPNNQQQKIAPLTLSYGQQPAPSSRATFYETAVGNWPPDLVLSQGPARSIAVLPPLVTTQPYRPVQPHLVTAWEPPWVSPPKPVAIAPLTLPSGQAPSPQAPLSSTALASIVASWPIEVGPRLPWQRPPSVVGTFPTVAQPQPQPALAVLELAQILGTWTQTWDAQTAPKNAAWNVPPILTTVAYAPQPRAIWSAWEPAWVSPPPLVSIAPLTLPYGQTSSPRAALSVTHVIQLASSWAQPWDAQTAAKNAGWNVPPVLIVLPHVAAPSLIWMAWEPAWVSPPRPVAIAPLTFTYGSQPSVQPPLARTVAGIILSAWPSDLEPRLGRPNAERTHITPLTLTYGSPPAPRGPIARQILTLLDWAWREGVTALQRLNLSLPGIGTQIDSGGQAVRPVGRTGVQVFTRRRVRDMVVLSTVQAVTQRTVSPHVPAAVSTSVFALLQLDPPGLVFAFATAHGLLEGDRTVIAGAIVPEYNGTFVVQYVDADNFQYEFGGSVSGGTGGPITSTKVPLPIERTVRALTTRTVRAL